MIKFFSSIIRIKKIFRGFWKIKVDFKCLFLWILWGLFTFASSKQFFMKTFNTKIKEIILRHWKLEFAAPRLEFEGNFDLFAGPCGQFPSPQTRGYTVYKLRNKGKFRRKVELRQLWSVFCHWFYWLTLKFGSIWDL